MSTDPAAGPPAVPTPPALDLARNRLDIKSPRWGADFASYVNALAGVATDGAELTLIATHDDKVVQRTWTGPCSADEFALLVATAGRFLVEAIYADESRLWLEFGNGSAGRWRWSTSGKAHDAAIEFTRTLKKSHKSRVLKFVWPCALLVAGFVMWAVWGNEVPALNPQDPPLYDYTGPLWYSLLAGGSAMIGFLALLAQDWTGFGASKRRYLRRLAPGSRTFSWRRLFVFGPIDVTNQVGIGLVLGLPAGGLLAILLGKWLGS